MQLIDAFVHNPVKVSVAVLLVVLFGLVSLTLMPMQLTPEVEKPTLTVDTRWPGASPQEIEREIVQEQEEQLKSVEGVTKMSSESSDSRGRITLEFLVGTDMAEAQLNVDSRLQQVREYPVDADRPVISTSNSSDRAIAWFILSSRAPSLAEVEEFAARYPQHDERLEPVRQALEDNVGLAMLRIRNLTREYPEFEELQIESPDVMTLRRFAEDEIESRFERVPGVAQSEVIGGLIDELQVIVDPQKLAARQVTLGQIRQVLVSQNTNVSAGDLWEGKRRWVVRVPGKFTSPESVGNQLIGTVNGASVFVRDVAEVRIGFKKPDGIVYRYGQATIAVNCARETGANVLDVMAGLQEQMEVLNNDILHPLGLQLTQVYDETEYIYSSVNLVQQNIFVGGALTMIVLMLFLHLGVRTLLVIPLILASALAAAYVSPWFFLICLAILIVVGFWFARGALVVGLAIPISIVGTFLVLGLLGRSLNVISLAGLAFAVGMLVDSAVVVLENIHRRRHSLGEPPFTAAVKGAQEVWGAVVASTLTTVAVFLPVVFIQEEAGQLFRDIALAISAAVTLSMLVSTTVIPTAAARLFSRRREERDEPQTAGQGVSSVTPRIYADGNGNGSSTAPHAPARKREERAEAGASAGALGRAAAAVVAPLRGFGAAFAALVVGVNAWIQRGLIRRVATVVLMVGVAMSLVYLLWPAVEYLPSGNRNRVIATLVPPPGYNLNQLEELGKTVQENLRPYWDVDPDSPDALELDYPTIGDFFYVVRGTSVFMGIKAHDASRAVDLIPLIQKATANLPGTNTVAKQSSLFERGRSAGRTVAIEITGPEVTRLVDMGSQIMGQVQAKLSTSQARPEPSLDLSSPEVHIRPKLLQAAEMQVNTTDLGFAANALVDGAYAGDYYLDGKKIDLTIIGQQQFARRTQDIQALPIATPVGQLVPLSALADVSLASGPEQINHRERERAITIEVSPPPEVPLETAMTIIRDEIVGPIRESGQLTGGYQINLSGTADKLRDTWRALRFNVMLALIITYLLMAALFESWLYPFVIILSVPLGAVGGVIGLWILNFFMFQSLDVLTMLGFVILIGTVVNNPILIVHQALNHMREDGMQPREAILESVRTRIRPIFMTTLTTVLGLMPLVVFPGAGSELYRGLGSVVLGGLLLSSFFTIFLVPTLFSLMMELKQTLVRALFGREIGELAPVPVPTQPAEAEPRSPHTQPQPAYQR